MANVYQAIAATATSGLVGVELTTGTVCGETFLDFVRDTLIPEMEPFDGTASKTIAVMDNCSIHDTGEVQQAFQENGILLMYLPPYSPDFNPIEETFSYIKYYLKGHDQELQSVTDPTFIVQAALDSVTEELCTSWVKHCGCS